MPFSEPVFLSNYRIITQAPNFLLLIFFLTFPFPLPQHFSRLGFQLSAMQVSSSGPGSISPTILCPLSLLCGHFCSQLVKDDVIINRKKLKHCPERKKTDTSLAVMQKECNDRQQCLLLFAFLHSRDIKF